MGDALQTPMTSRSGGKTGAYLASSTLKRYHHHCLCPATAAIPLTATQLDIRKKYDRLREMFQENIAAFREAVYLLTGYKVSTPSPTST